MHAWLRVCLGATLKGRRQRVLCCQAWRCANILGVCHGVGRPHTGLGGDGVLVSGAQLGLCGCVSNMGQSACSITESSQGWHADVQKRSPLHKCNRHCTRAHQSAHLRSAIVLSTKDL